MQTYKPELSAAIARFEARPGVTAAQVDQLRSSLVADADVLASMNAEAASGALCDFAVSSAQGKPIPTGHYDPATGVVTLPDSVFSTADASVSSNLTSVIAGQALVVKFSGQSYADARGPGQPVSTEMIANLQDTLNGSPVLAGEIKRAATTDDPDPVAPSAPVESALHKELRNTLPSETSRDRIAQIAFAAKEGGIEAGRIRTKDVVGGNLMLTGMTPGTRACVDLTSPPPSADLSNAQFHTLAIQQNAEQRVQAVQAHAASAMLQRH